MRKKLTKDEQGVNYALARGKWRAIYDHIKNDNDRDKTCEKLVELFEPKKNQKP